MCPHTYNNPVKFTDPSGHCAETGDDGCWSLAEQLWNTYDLELTVLGTFDYATLEYMRDTFNDPAMLQSAREYIVEVVRMTQEAPEVSTSEDRFVDAAGVRGGFGAVGGVGFDVSLDLLYNFNSSELSLLFNFNVLAGPQAGSGGRSGQSWPLTPLRIAF